MNKFFTSPKLRIAMLSQLNVFYNNTHMDKFNLEEIERCEITSSIEMKIKLVGNTLYVVGLPYSTFQLWNNITE